MLVLAIALAIIAAVIEHLVGINEPWRKVILIGIVVLFVVGLISLIFPGLIPVTIRLP